MPARHRHPRVTDPRRRGLHGLVRSLRLRVQRRDEGGFALVLVLGVILLTSLLVVALLGLALTTARIAAVQSQAARETRSADGALESAVATMSASTAGGDCPGMRPSSTVTFDNGTTGTVDDDTVTVACGNAAVSLDPTQPLGGNDVKLVGDSGTTLTSTGAAPLRFTADVTVRRGADVTGPSGGPAVSADGQYVQGLPGPGAGGSDCGPLGTSGGPSYIDDRDGKPTCGDGAAANLSVSTQELVDASDPTAAPPRVTPACPAGNVVELEPGSYDAVQTSALNVLMGGGSGGCSNRTFWFKPSADPGRAGVFAFDANPNRAGGAALVIDDPTIRVIVGRPAGGNDAAAAAAAAFPAACDRSAAGASFQLSGRMSLQHRAGLVAICPAWNLTTPLPALVQVPEASLDPITVAASSTDFTTAGGANGGTALVASPGDSSASATATFGCSYLAWDFSCSPINRSLSATFANVPPDVLTSARVLIASKETPPAADPNQYRRVQLGIVGAGGTQLCTTGYIEGGRTNWQLSSYDLLSDAGCRAALQGKPGSVLEGATVTATYQMNVSCFGWPTVDCPPAGTDVPTLSVRGIRLITNAVVAEASSATSSSGWTNAAAIRADDGSAAVYPQEACDLIPSCVYDTPGRTASVTAQDLRFPSGTSGPPSTLRVLVRNTQAGPAASWSSDPIDGTATQLQLTLASGQQCTVSSTGYSHSSQESEYDLLGSGSPGCAGIVSDLSQLQGASVRVQYTTGCAWVGSSQLTPGADGRCGSVALPQVQYVALAATTTSVPTRPPSSQITVDVGAGTDFHAFGATVMPRSDVQVRWKGGADTAVPLFFGSFVAFGLDSTMAGGSGAQMGIVCCERPPSGTARLEASVGGTLRAIAVVTIGPRPGGGPGHDVEVQDWQLCVTGSCDTTPTTRTGPAPP